MIKPKLKALATDFTDAARTDFEIRILKGPNKKPTLSGVGWFRARSIHAIRG
jgi:hypothetical protein